MRRIRHDGTPEAQKKLRNCGSHLSQIMIIENLEMTQQPEHATPMEHSFEGQKRADAAALVSIHGKAVTYQ